MKKLCGMVVIACMVLAGLTGSASAACATGAQTCSTDYQVNEAFFGSGGNLNSCSTNYCTKQSAGELTVGNTQGNQFQAQAGFNTDREPYIEFSVSNTNVNLGTLTASSATFTTATFTVKAYLAHGYSVVNASPPPSNGSYTIHSLTTPTASSPGTEQFGINLAHNASAGQAPVQVPDSTFGYGFVPGNYDGSDLYEYNQGDTIAESNSSSSDTTYTITYMFNVSHVTPGGTYTFHHVLVATATY